VRRGAIVRLVAIGVVAGVAAALVAVLIPWLPTSASQEMDRMTDLFWFATVICIGIFVVVVAVLVYSVLAFRVQPDDDSDGPPIHGNTALEIVWTVVPAILVTSIAVYSAIVLAQNSDAGTNPYPVRIFAQQFAWRFEYPQEDNLKSGELILPLDRKVELEMQSADVIHSFWVPQMGQKQDLVPGIPQQLVITPTRTGTFPLICTELCGLGHATMRATVRVLDEAAFRRWVSDQQEAAGGGGGGGGEGEQLFAAQGCGGCHALEKAGTDAQIGPPLELATLQAAAEAAGEPLDEFVANSIVDPDADVAAGYQPGVMPKAFGDALSDEELAALVEYLTTGAK
jgi:cytochrome c oxidase subunit 2